MLLALLVSLAVRDGAPAWISISSLTAAGAAIILALGRVVRHAVRLGSRVDPPAARAELARGILRDHFVFLALMVGVLVVQLVGVT